MSYRKSSSDEVREWMYLLLEMGALTVVGTLGCMFAHNNGMTVCQPIFSLIELVKSNFTKENVQLVAGVVADLTANKNLKAAVGTLNEHFKQIDAGKLAAQTKTIPDGTNLKIQQQNVSSQEQFPIGTDINEFVTTYTYFLNLPGVDTALVLPQTVQYFVTRRFEVISRIATYCNSLYDDNKKAVNNLLKDVKNKTTNFEEVARLTFNTANQKFVTEFLQTPSDPGLMNCYVYFIRLKFDVFKYYEAEQNLSYVQKSYLFLCAGLLVVLTAVQQLTDKNKEATALITLVYIMFNLSEAEYIDGLKVLQSQAQPHPELPMA